MSGTRLAAPAGFDQAADTPLRRALRACRKQFLLVGLFSGAVNVLQLTTSLYMMQVFDRVLSTRVLDTLLYLSLIAGAAVLVLAMLEAARGQIMQRVASWVENRVAPEGLRARHREHLARTPLTAWRPCATSRSAAASSARPARSRSTTCPGCRSTSR
jgi:ATP-binding cassette subfamily C protein/ATP-binding cassette subfamily C protein EexD